MKNVFKLIIDAIGKGLAIFKDFLTEIYNFHLYYQVFGFRRMFMLMLLLNRYFTKNKAVKKIKLGLLVLTILK